ncbi:MAG: AraC family transcriptional regulator [Myxococcota bacterium]
MSLLQTPVVSTGALRVTRVVCDGDDSPGAESEPSPDDRVIVVLRGVFELRDRHRRVVVDPTRAYVTRGGEGARYRHPCGCGDVCLSFAGHVASRLAAAGAPVRSVSDRGWTELHAAARSADPLAVEEAAWSALTDDDPAADRGLADDVIDVLRARPGRLGSLAEVAREVGRSEAHLCRVFRAATGTTIAAFHRELRLRHALAWVLDTREPLLDVALVTGFASQAHLTNQFRDRFGVTPARARRQGSDPLAHIAVASSQCG